MRKPTDAVDDHHDRAGDPRPPGSRPFPHRAEGAESLPQIEHIVIYMQENHSYDNYFGMLRRGDGFTLARRRAR